MTSKKRENERGVALVFVAISLVVILGFTALGIDIARHAHLAAEVQTVADAAARGGAKALYDAGGDPGEGIAGAHVISAANIMNGTLAPDADVKVDEGFWDVDSGKFECCTSNSPCCENSGTSPWDTVCKTTTRDCTANRKAVLAVPQTTVTNLLAGIFDSTAFANAAIAAGDNKHSTIEKLAIASASGPVSGCKMPEECENATNKWQCSCEHGVAPCLPIAAPSCKFDCSGTSCTLPPLVVATGSDSASFTTFSVHNASTDVLRDFFAGSTANCGQGSGDPDHVETAGSDLELQPASAGQGTKSPYSIVQCLIGQEPTKKNQQQVPPQGCTYDEDTKQITGWGGTVFTIPIFDLDTCNTSMNQSQTLVGFATVEITDVVTVGTNTINLRTIANTSDTGAPSGGECFRTDCSVAMNR